MKVLGVEWAWWIMGLLNSKQIFLGLRCGWFAKNQTVCLVWRFNRRFERFNVGLITKWFIEMDRIGKFINRRFDRAVRFFKPWSLLHIYIYIPPWLKTWLGISHEKSSHGRLIPYHYTHEIILFGFIIFETVDHWAWGYVLVSIFHNFFNVAIGMIFTISPFSVITRLIIHLLPMHLIYNGFKCEAICFV